MAIQHSAATLDMTAVSKSFGQVVALRSGNLQAHPGSIHALVGENGAGKSTLVKIAAGVYRRDGGQMRRQRCVQHRPRRREFDRAVPPLEEGRLKEGLQLADLPADGRLRDAQLFRGLGEAEQPGRRLERDQRRKGGDAFPKG